MNGPYEKLEEIRNMIKIHAEDKNLDDTLTRKEHYKEMFNFVNIIEKELEKARYQFVYETVDGEVIDIPGDITMSKIELDEEIIILQPLFDDDATWYTFDLEELANTLEEAINQNILDKNILLFPPNISVLKAKLSK